MEKNIDGEEILCEYIPKVNHVKYLIIFLATMIFFFYILDKNFNIEIFIRKMKLSDISLRKITYFDFFIGLFCWRELNFYKKGMFLFYTMITDTESDSCMLKMLAQHKQDPSLISELKSCSKTYVTKMASPKNH
jgi:hypothetical protein